MTGYIICSIAFFLTIYMVEEAIEDFYGVV